MLEEAGLLVVFDLNTSPSSDLSRWVSLIISLLNSELLLVADTMPYLMFLSMLFLCPMFLFWFIFEMLIFKLREELFWDILVAGLGLVKSKFYCYCGMFFCEICI